MTLLEQLEEVACSRVNEHWYAAISPPRAVSDLLAKAYEENWPRGSFHARVILECARRLKTMSGLAGEGIEL